MQGIAEFVHVETDLLHDPKFKIAASRRMLYRNGLDSLIGGHVSVRADDGESYWITPRQYFDETLPRDVGRVTFEGKVVDEATGLGRSPGIAFHAAIYRARPDVNCVIHTHARSLTVLTTLQQPAAVFHDHGALFVDQVVSFQETVEHNATNAADQIAAGLGDKRVILLRNHGSVNVAESIEVATGEAILLEWAATHQLASTAAGGMPMHIDLARWYRQAYQGNAASRLVWDANLRRLHRSDPDLFSVPPL